jgi:hypothetical protein
LESSPNMSTASRIHSRRDFREWERRCDPDALKSTLYYAAHYLRLAHEAHRGNEFDAEREKILTQVAKLKQTMHQLTTIRIQRKPVAAWAMFLWGVKKNEMKFFQSFPALLVRFENILKVLKLPRERPDTLKDWLIASGELLLHLYVKEVTSKKFLEENAALLEAAAVSTGLDYRQPTRLRDDTTDS